MSRNHQSLDPKRWTRARRRAFDRDGWRCTECGKAGRLEAHHEPPLREGVDPYRLGSIVTLCRHCHLELHRPDDMTPGRAEWIELIEELVTK